jgi:hypothetical protein
MTLVELEEFSKIDLVDEKPKDSDIFDQDDILKLSIFERFRRSRTTLVTVVWIAIFVDCLFYSIVIPLLPLYLEQLKVSQVILSIKYPVAYFQSLIGVLYSSFSVSIL